MGQWISAEERLPEQQIPVLVSSQWKSPLSSRARIQAVAWLNKNGEWERWTTNGGTVSWKGYIVYWMPIPPTPDTPQEAL